MLFGGTIHVRTQCALNLASVFASNFTRCLYASLPPPPPPHPPPLAHTFVILFYCVKFRPQAECCDFNAKKWRSHILESLNVAVWEWTAEIGLLVHHFPLTVIYLRGLHDKDQLRRCTFETVLQHEKCLTTQTTISVKASSRTFDVIGLSTKCSVE